MNHYFTNDKVDSKISIINSKINNNNYDFYVDNGVFSKGKVDFGTILLLETIKNIKGKVLDVGCGYGVIGIYLRKNFDCEVDMVDINLRALELAKKNSKKYKLSNINIFESDTYTNINNKYDIIITNPPIRAGKQKVYEILLGAKEHLNKESKLYFVMRKDQGAKSTIEYLKNHYTVSILEKSNGFWIICAEN